MRKGEKNEKVGRSRIKLVKSNGTKIGIVNC